MGKKTLVILAAIFLFIVAVIYVLNPASPKKQSDPSLTIQPKLAQQGTPSQTLKEYVDPSGFSFSYPDNLTLTTNEIIDNSTYTDLKLGSKEVNGSLALKITDSKLTSIDEWLKVNKIASSTAKQVKLGNLSAVETKFQDRVIVGALDKGILFTLEIPAIEEAFWR